MDAAFAQEMDRWEAAGLRRRLEGDAAALEGSSGLADFTSNDTLSLARHPEVVGAARAALAEFGAGGRASRLLGGGCPLDRAAERAAAEWLGAEDALLFPSGYQANLGLVSALAGRGDVLFCDALVHASLIDAARLSRARVAVFAHNDLDELAALLGREGAEPQAGSRAGAGAPAPALPARAAARAPRRLVLVESVYSMDGDAAPLGALADLCARHGAGLVVDEAHAIGLLGPRGAGAWARLEAEDAARDSAGDAGRREDDSGAASPLVARIVTGGKALGVAGGLVVGSRALREHLVNHARSFVFTSGVSPAVSGGLVAAIRIAAAADGARAAVLGRARRLARAIGAPEPTAAIVSHLVGDERETLALQAALREQGFDARAVRPPTVPPGTARLRLVCHAHGTDADVDRLAAAVSARSGGSAADLGRARTTAEAGSDGAGAPSARPRGGRAAPPTPLRAASSRARLLAVVGTDTGVGKTVVSALLLRAAARLGAAAYWKPVQTGGESDTEAVRALVADLETPRLLAPLHAFPLPASPHEAAAAAGSRVDVPGLLGRLAALHLDGDGRSAPRTGPDGTPRGPRAAAALTIVELAGGLLVPYDDTATQADVLAAARPELVLVARSGLGTLNHTLLTLEALAARGLAPRALFLVGTPHAGNRATLAARSGVPRIFELPPLAPLEGAALEGWLADNDLSPLLRSCGAGAA